MTAPDAAEVRRGLRVNREALAIAAIMIAAALLRLPALSWLPAVAGDEGNWARYAGLVYQHGSVELDPVHRASSPLFAYLLGAAMHVTGHSYLGMRLVVALVVIFGCFAAYRLLARAGLPRAGLGAACVLAVHPWSVIWSRTVAVPYALALVLMTLAAIAFFLGLRLRSGARVAFAIALIALAAHFSPLAIVLAPPFALAALERDQRWLLRHPVVLAAIAVAALLALPFVLWMRALPPLANEHVHAGIAARAASAVHMIATGLPGETTLRYFTNHALPLVPAALVALLLWTLLLRAARRSADAHAPLARFGVLVLGCGASLLPLALAPGRLWYLPTIDGDRYLFVLLPGLALVIGALLQSTVRSAQRLAVVTLAVLLVASIRLLAPLALGHGSSRGLSVLGGGECWRGWLTAREHEPPVTVVAELAAQLRPAAVLYDGFALQTMRFAFDPSPLVYASVTDRAAWQQARGLMLVVLWAPGGLDPPAAAKQARRNATFLAELREQNFTAQALERRIDQPDGTPLFEVWSAREH